MRQRKRRTIPLRKSQTNYVSGTSFTTKLKLQKARSKRWMSAVAKVRFENMCRQKITQCPFGQRVFEYWQNILAVYRAQNFCNRMRIFVTQRFFTPIVANAERAICRSCLLGNIFLKYSHTTLTTKSGVKNEA